MAEPRPAQDIIDTLIWERLGSFWTERYDQSDRIALSSVYEAAAKVIEGELVRAFEIDKAKSIVDCPVYGQRRWLRLDLGRYAEMRDWLRFLGGAGLPTEGADGSATELLCENSEAHPRHWHIRFPWDSRARGSTINLGYRISPELVEGYRSDGSAGTFGVDYAIAAGGRTLQILRPDTYDFTIGLDFSNAAYDAVSWIGIRAAGVSGPDSVPLPDGFGQGGAIHALLVRNPPSGTSTSFFSSNSAAFATQQTFFPSATVLPGNNLRVPGVTAGDVVLLFGLVAGASTQTHTHQATSAVLPGSTPVASWQPSVAPGASVLFGTPGLFSHEIRLYRDGVLLSPSKYSYDPPTNTFFFGPALSNPGGTINLNLEWTEDSTGGAAHRHYSCASATLTSVDTYDTFDDGGTFDDDGAFDTFGTASVATFPFTLELSTLAVFANGILLTRGEEYSAAVVGTTTVVTFGTRLATTRVEARYRRESLAYSYGSDLPSSLPATAVTKLATDLANVSAAFTARFGTTLRNISSLVESANVLAAGGNPLLTLFTDEWADYNGLPVDAAGAPIDSATARAVESSQTKLVAIPFLQDHVLNPTVRLQAGVDFVVSDGAVLSSEDLTSSRGVDDTAPGVWWCPLVLLDERMLAKNFGALVDDQRDSSEAYRGLLTANLNLRYGGPTPQNVQAAVAAYAGSAIVRADAAVTGVRSEVAARVVTITAQGGAQQTVEVATTTNMSVGTPVAAGQSLARPLAFAGLLSGVVGFTGGEMQLSPPNPGFTAGATVRLALSEGYGTFTVASIWTESQALRDVQHIIFTGATTLALSPAPLAAVYLPGPGPFAAFDGTVTGVVDRARQYLLTTAGEYPLTEAPIWPIGTQLSRGQAVEPQLATILAHDTNKDWYKQKPFGTVQVSSVRDAFITPGLTYATGQFEPAFPELVRGTVVTVGSQKYQVVGSSGGVATLTPSVASAGPAIITPPVNPAFSRYEFALSGISSAVPGTVGANASAVAVTSAAEFPASGRVAVVDANGRRVTFDYAYKDGDVFRGLRWDETGAITNGTAYALSELKDARIHPAFAALVAQRTQSSVALSLGDPTTETLYDLLKTNALVVETKTPERPASLRLLLEETLPAHISAMLYSTHVVKDAVQLAPVDLGTASPSFDVTLTTVETPGPSTQAISFKAAPTYASTANAAAVLASWNASTYGWTARVTGGPSTTLSIATPFGKSTQIFGFLPGGSYLVTFKAVTPAGLVRTSSISVVC